MKVSIQPPWSVRPESFRDMQFWRSWLELDPSDLNEDRSGSRVNWPAVFGLALMVLVSAAFWTGVGFLIAYLVK